MNLNNLLAGRGKTARKMDAIIVAKTRMKNNACIGAVALEDGRFLRLLKSSGTNWDFDTKFEVGQVYAITFQERTDKKPPHIEDILVNQMKYKSTLSNNKINQYLTDKLGVKICISSIENLFDGKLQWTNGLGFISKGSELPDNSVGFWITDKKLSITSCFYEKIKYYYRQEDSKRIIYVGFQEPIDFIPAGTLVRVSLARWWAPPNQEKRCYLQLSGWYGDL